MRHKFADQVPKCRTSPVPLAAGFVKTFLHDGSRMCWICSSDSDMYIQTHITTQNI